MYNKSQEVITFWFVLGKILFWRRKKNVMITALGIGNLEGAYTLYNT